MTDIQATGTDDQAQGAVPERPLGISIIAALAVIGGVGALLLSFYGMTQGAFPIGFVLAAVSLVLAYGLWTLASWAWPLAVVLIALSTLDGVRLLLAGSFNTNLVVGPIELVYLFQGSIRSLFKR